MITKHSKSSLSVRDFCHASGAKHSLSGVCFYDSIWQDLISKVTDISNPEGKTVVSAFDILTTQVVELNTSVGEYEESHSRDGTSVESMIAYSRSIIEARSGKDVELPSNYQSGSVLSVPEHQKLLEELSASGSYVEHNLTNYTNAITQYGQRWNDKCAEDRKEEGFWTALGGVMSVIAGAALIVAAAGMAAPIVIGAFVVGSTSMLYGLSNSAEGLNSISLGFQGDGKTAALNPIRDTFFANNPELYYTIGNVSTLVSSLAIPIGGAGNAALSVGTSPLRAMVVEGGKVLVSSAAGEAASKYVYNKTGNMTLSTLTGMGVGGLTYGGMAKIDSVANLSGLNSRVNVTNLKESADIKDRGSDDILIDSYKNLRKNKEVVGQAHHLNQDAAFRDVIPKNDGGAVKLEGNIRTQINSPHYNAHKSLEELTYQN